MPGKLATYPFEQCFRWEFRFILVTVIDECKSTSSATSELSLQTENRDSLFIRLELFRNAFFDGCFRNIARFWMNELDGLKHLTLVIWWYRSFRLSLQTDSVKLTGLTHYFLFMRGLTFILWQYRMKFLSDISAYILNNNKLRVAVNLTPSKSIPILFFLSKLSLSSHSQSSWSIKDRISWLVIKMYVYLYMLTIR